MLHDPCQVCDRPLKREATWWVHLNVAGEMVPVHLDIDPQEDLGWFPVGADCARNIPFDLKAKEIS